MSAIVELKGAGRAYDQGGLRTEALKPTNLMIDAGQYVALTGKSGSGKSTLLNLISGIDRPTTGVVIVADADLGALSEAKLSKLRGEKIGIVFQFFELIPTLTAIENVVLAMDLVGCVPAARRRPRALDLLASVGLSDHAGKLPSKLSGGEQQRVAIARALANDPPILVADEPSGNLDSANSETIRKIFEACRSEGRTVIVATHERDGLERYDRVLQIVDGALEPDKRKSVA